MSVFLVLAGLALAGIVLTAYLLCKRFQKKAPICFAGASCTVVLTSRYNKLLGVPNELLGFLFYGFVFVLSVLLWWGMGPAYYLPWLVQLAIILGAFMSIFLLYLQWRVLKAWCSWCITSAIINFCLELVLVWSW